MFKKNTNIKLYIYVVLLPLFVFSCHLGKSYAATYDEVKWAFGYVMGHVMQFMAYHDACSAKFPNLKGDLDDALRDWGTRNRSLDQVRDALYLRARQEGGEAEARNAASEIREAMKSMRDDMRQNANSLDEQNCEKYLIATRQGVYDFSRVLVKEISVILSK